jgi:hypothetical protein
VAHSRDLGVEVLRPEIGFAVCRRVLVVPVRFGVDPYGFIGKYQALTFRSGDQPAVVARSIFDLLVRHPASQGAMALSRVAVREHGVV